MVVRRYRLYKAQELKQLERTLIRKVGELSIGWFDVESVICEANNVGELSDADPDSDFELNWHSASGWLAVAREPLPRLAALVLPAEEPLAPEAALLRDEVVLDYLSALAEALKPDSQTNENEHNNKPERHFLPGCGWFVARVNVNGIALTCLIGPSVAQHILGTPKIPSRTEKLATLRNVMKDQQIVLRAELGATTLSIGEIKQLRVGDVVALDGDLDQKMKLTTPSGQILASADLGVSEGKKALRILAPYS